MNKITYNLTLDLEKSGIQGFVNARCNDTNSIEFAISLTKGKTTYSIASGTTVVFRAKKPSGKVVFNNATIVDNVIKYVATTQTLTEVGNTLCEVELIDTNGQLTSVKFLINVEDILYSDKEVESTNEFTELTKAILKVEELEEDIDESLEEVEDALEDVDAKMEEVDAIIDKIDNVDAEIEMLPSTSEPTVDVTFTDKMHFAFGIPNVDTESVLDDAKEYTDTKLRSYSTTQEIANAYVDKTSYNEKVAQLQAEIDGAITTYSDSYVPTLTNKPASDWTTDTEKDKHIGDIYLVNSEGGDEKGFSYRFEKNNGTYSWVHVPDNDVQKALKDIADLQKDLDDNYSTTAEMNTAIGNSATSTLGTVASTYATKTEAQGYGTSAESNAKGYTDNKLSNYYTKSEADNKLSFSHSSGTTLELATQKGGALIEKIEGASIVVDGVIKNATTTTDDGITMTVEEVGENGESNTKILPFPTELCGINDIKDYVENGVLHKKIGKVDLGSLNYKFYPYETYDNCDRYLSTGLDNIAYGLGTCISADFTVVSNFEDTPNTLYLGGGNGKLSISVAKGSYASASEFKASLSGKYLYFRLATEQTYDYPYDLDLESYKDKTTITTEEGLATLKVEYSQNEIGAMTLENNIKINKILNGAE